MKPWAQFSLKSKLRVMMTLIAILTLLVSMVVSATRSVIRFRANLIEQEGSLADVMAHNLGPVLAFGNTREGTEMLKALSTQPHVLSAEIHQVSVTGELSHFAVYNPGEHILEMPPLIEGKVDNTQHLVVTRPVLHRGEQFGWLQIALSMSPIKEEIRGQILHTLFLVLVCTIAAYKLAKRFTRKVTVPIDNLVSVARKVSDEHDYAHRADHWDQEEMETLSRAFNDMLDQIEQRDKELTEAQKELVSQIKQLDSNNRKLMATRKRELELKDKLERAQRMESLGVLAGGVAHDLNNILGPVVGYPDLMLEEMTEDDPLFPDLVEIRNAAEKAGIVVQDLLALGRRGSYQFEPLLLNDVVSSYLNTPGFRQAITASDRLGLQLELDPELGSIKGSASHLSQVIMNLAINAIEAMGDQGQLCIATRNVTFENRRHGFETIEPGDYVSLSVSDSGEGIPPENLERIFEPFFSQKETGASGSGLGLAVVYGVAKDHGAFIDIETQLGKGTTIQFFFPRVYKAIRAKEAIVEPTGGTEHILVVDDELAQRRLAHRVLSHLGYQVSLAPSGREALRFLHHNRVDLVLLDMIMEEDFDGLDTYREINKLYPGQKCIIVSGYSENERIQQAFDLGVGGFVLKPYGRCELGLEVRKCLDEPAADRKPSGEPSVDAPAQQSLR